MENYSNQQKELIYPENITDILLGILQKYGLDETEEATIKKIETDQPFNGEVIMGLITEVLLGRLITKDLPNTFQEKLSIDQKTAENLAADINSKIIPLIKSSEVPPEEPKKVIMSTSEEITEKEPFAEPLTNKKPMLPQRDNLDLSAKKIKKSLPQEGVSNIIPQPTQKKGPDSYREPIE